jgi:hypothetical protein
MIKTHLTSGEIHDLINKYNSELKKLEFQIEDVKMTISGLESLMKDVNIKEKVSFAKVKSKRKNINVKPVAKQSSKIIQKKPNLNITPVSKQKKESPKKVSAKKISVNKSVPVAENKGYKLSDWDIFVIQSIDQSGKVLITSEIIDIVKKKMISAGKKTNDKEIKNKVTRSLQKLVNRRGDLSKVQFKGKGFAYALPKWLDENGKINPDFKR